MYIVLTLSALLLTPRHGRHNFPLASFVMSWTILSSSPSVLIWWIEENCYELVRIYVTLAKAWFFYKSAFSSFSGLLRLLLLATHQFQAQRVALRDDMTFRGRVWPRPRSTHNSYGRTSLAQRSRYFDRLESNDHGGNQNHRLALRHCLSYQKDLGLSSSLKNVFLASCVLPGLVGFLHVSYALDLLQMEIVIDDPLSVFRKRQVISWDWLGKAVTFGKQEKFDPSFETDLVGRLTPWVSVQSARVAVQILRVTRDCIQNAPPSLRAHWTIWL